MTGYSLCEEHGGENDEGTCPHCEEQRRLEAERAERMGKGQNMHPTVDAPRR